MITMTLSMIETILKNPGEKTQGLPNSRIIHKMLAGMYERQTQDEKRDGATKHDNGVGFSGRDSEVLSDIAVKTRVKGDFFTPKQCAFVARLLFKYRRQLLSIAQEKLTAAAVKAGQPVPVFEKVRTTKKAPVSRGFEDIPLGVQQQLELERAEEAVATEAFNENWIELKNDFSRRERQQEEAAFMSDPDFAEFRRLHA